MALHPPEPQGHEAAIRVLAVVAVSDNDNLDFLDAWQNVSLRLE